MMHGYLQFENVWTGDGKEECFNSDMPIKGCVEISRNMIGKYHLDWLLDMFVVSRDCNTISDEPLLLRKLFDRPDIVMNNSDLSPLKLSRTRVNNDAFTISEYSIKCIYIYMYIFIFHLVYFYIKTEMNW